MSKYKQSLPEDIDVTDVRDTFVPVLDDDLPDATDYAVSNLQDAVGHLEDLEGHLTVYYEELATELRKLAKLVESARMPF